MRLDLSTHFPLRKARVHEVCGSAATGFAAIAASFGQGNVLWIRQAWRAETLNPTGLVSLLDPAQVLLAQAKDQTEALAVMEEALRDGSVACVVIELNQPLSLTAGRRLQLAAKEGQATGICLISEGMGSNAAETRWRCEPVFDPAHSDTPLMRWSLIKNKSGSLSDWHIRWDGQKTRPADRLVMVSAPA
ncbi:hypothetical protein ROA7450_03146 [Roseovarius albus]|uniref:Protein ImuA n=1 Tax=Roseovarius albus TaxID=1247867 RepID=A0A1X6ZTU7_9RHOB|nr:hypothetical protein [Roseovarius albus]SLN61047.1 hypothetical protein ROA7450_03146 [Roseovarius albus]